MPQLPETFDQMLAAGKYMKSGDFPEPRVCTIERFTRENVAKEDEPPEDKWIAHFMGEEKALVLNSTNLQILKMAFGKPADAIGKQVQIYTDPNVSYGGKLVGGLRLRGPKKAPSAPVSASAFDDIDIPF